MNGGAEHQRPEWPTDEAGLCAAQRELAAASPPLWQPARPAPATDHAGSSRGGSSHAGDGRAGDARGPRIAGAWICFPRGLSGTGRAGDPAWTAAVVSQGRRVLGHAVRPARAGAAYRPGLLALREGPALAEVVRAMEPAFDVLLVNATGRDHPRGCGLALHLGAVLDVPTVGITHRPLLATGDWPPDAYGAHTPRYRNGAPVGAWVTTRLGTRPLAVDAAWRTTPEVAIEVALLACAGHRTPEPLRRARQHARRARAANPAADSSR